MENSEEKSLQFPCDYEEGPVGVPGCVSFRDGSAAAAL